MPKSISVRLTTEAAFKLAQLNSMGHKTSNVINELLSSTPVINALPAREIMRHICQIQSEIEFETDPEIKNNIRKELNDLCRLLKSSAGTTQTPKA